MKIIAGVFILFGGGYLWFFFFHLFFSFPRFFTPSLLCISKPSLFRSSFAIAQNPSPFPNQLQVVRYLGTTSQSKHCASFIRLRHYVAAPIIVPSMSRLWRSREKRDSASSRIGFFWSSKWWFMVLHFEFLWMILLNSTSPILVEIPDVWEIHTDVVSVGFCSSRLRHFCWLDVKYSGQTTMLKRRLWWIGWALCDVAKGAWIATFLYFRCIVSYICVLYLDSLLSWPQNES